MCWSNSQDPHPSHDSQVQSQAGNVKLWNFICCVCCLGIYYDPQVSTHPIPKSKAHPLKRLSVPRTSLIPIPFPSPNLDPAGVCLKRMCVHSPFPTSIPLPSPQPNPAGVVFLLAFNSHVQHPSSPQATNSVLQKSACFSQVQRPSHSRFRNSSHQEWAEGLEYSAYSVERARKR